MLFIIASIQREDIGCILCKKGIDEVYGLLENGATKEAIEQFLEGVCNLFDNEETKQVCKAFIDTEYDKLIQFLENSYSSEVICTLLSACDYPLPPINTGCDACLVGFGFLEDLWSYKPTEEMIEIALEYVCNIFPSGDARNECVAFVDKEFEKLVDWIDKEFPPQFMCTAVGACDFPVDPVEDGLCLFCEGAMTFIYDFFEFDEKNGAELIATVLEYICLIFPEGESREICDEFIEKEAQKLIDFIEHEFPPENICILAGACESNITPVYDTECEFCEIFYQFAIDMLDFEYTIEAIEHLLEHICEIFPDTIQIVCKKFVDVKWEQLLELLNEDYPADVACQLLGACVE